MVLLLLFHSFPLIRRTEIVYCGVSSIISHTQYIFISIVLPVMLRYGNCVYTLEKPSVNAHHMPYCLKSFPFDVLEMVTFRCCHTFPEYICTELRTLTRYAINSHISAMQTKSNIYLGYRASSPNNRKCVKFFN